MKKRTAFETALVRRVAKKNDYLRYAAYEMGLEALRKKRAERLSEYLTAYYSPCHDPCLNRRITAHNSLCLRLRSRTEAVPHIRAIT